MSRDVISSGKFQADRFWCPRDYQISSLNFEWLWQAVGWVIDVLAAITQIDFYRSCLALSLSLFCLSFCFIYLFIFWSGVVSWCRLSANIRVFCFFLFFFIFYFFIFFTLSAFDSNTIANALSCLVNVLFFQVCLTNSSVLLEGPWKKHTRNPRHIIN